MLPCGLICTPYYAQFICTAMALDQLFELCLYTAFYTVTYISAEVLSSQTRMKRCHDIVIERNGKGGKEGGRKDVSGLCGLAVWRQHQ